MPSTNLVNYVCTAYAILEFVDYLITKSCLPVRKAAEHVLSYCFLSFETFACTTHEAKSQISLKNHKFHCSKYLL